MAMAQELAEYCHGLKFQQLPEEVVDRVKYFFLDFIGVCIRGSQENSSRSIYRFVREMGGGNRGGVLIGTKERAAHLYSALGNGASAHAIEMDDVNNKAFPAVLATSKMVGEGKEHVSWMIREKLKWRTQGSKEARENLQNSFLSGGGIRRGILLEVQEILSDIEPSEQRFI
jgi:2-methylcitrate dehydratase PrpD